jgi:hypothetical protein
MSNTFITGYLRASVAFCPTIEQAGTVVNGKFIKEDDLLIGRLRLKFFLLSLSISAAGPDVLLRMSVVQFLPLLSVKRSLLQGLSSVHGSFHTLPNLIAGREYIDFSRN